MKKLLAMATSLALLATSAIVPMTAAAAEEKEVTKPEKITIMVDTTLVNQANGRDAFEARWEKLTGIDLVINQPDHSAYYDFMQQSLAVRAVIINQQRVIQELDTGDILDLKVFVIVGVERRLIHGSP